MSETGSVVSVRRRRSRAEADRLVVEFERSGMGRKAFCVAHGVSLHTLDYYRRQRCKSGSRAAGSILPVELVDGRAAAAAAPMDSRSAFRVQLACGRRIEVDTGLDATELIRLIAALEAA
jgi:hypothetical protein